MSDDEFEVDIECSGDDSGFEDNTGFLRCGQDDLGFYVEIEKEKIVDIRVQQRTSKNITSVTGLDPKLLRVFKKKFSCNGSILGETIILQGDQRQNIKNYIIEKNIVPKYYIIVHGF